MYAFGVDIPLIEVLLVLAVINIILLIEITIVLVFVMRRLKDAKLLAMSLVRTREKKL